MPFCENCGTKLSDTAKFCPNCGHKAVGATSADGQASPVASAPNEPSKEDIVRYLSVYAKDLFSLQQAIRRLFPLHPPYANMIVKFEGESCVLHVEPDYETKPNFNRNLYSALLFDWPTLYLHKDEVINQKVSYISAGEIYGLECSGNSPLLQCPKFEYLEVAKLPEVLLRTWQSCFDMKDPEAIGTFQRKVKDVFAAIGDWSEIYDAHDFDATKKYQYPEGLDELRKASLLAPSAFLDVMKKKSRYFAEALWAFRYDATNPRHNTPKKYLKKPGIFSSGKYIRSCEDRSLCKALDEALAFFPGQKELASCLPAACDAIEEMAKALNESFSNRFYLPPQYRSPECAVGLARLLLDGKADTWKEAMILFDTEKYREAVIQGLGSISDQIAFLNQQVKGLSTQTSAILGELKTTNIKLSSIETSTFITAVFGDE